MLQPFVIAITYSPYTITCGLWGHLWKNKTLLAKWHILHSKTSQDPLT